MYTRSSGGNLEVPSLAPCWSARIACARQVKCYFKLNFHFVHFVHGGGEKILSNMQRIYASPGILTFVCVYPGCWLEQRYRVVRSSINQVTSTRGVCGLLFATELSATVDHVCVRVGDDDEMSGRADAFYLNTKHSTEPFILNIYCKSLGITRYRSSASWYADTVGKHLCHHHLSWRRFCGIVGTKHMNNQIVLIFIVGQRSNWRCFAAIWTNVYVELFEW